MAIDIQTYLPQLLEDTARRLKKLDEIFAQPKIKCIANITMTDEQVQEVFEKVKADILAAQPERKRGEWTLMKEHVIPIYKCSQCNHASLGGNYCAYCGSYNGGEKT